MISDRAIDMIEDFEVTSAQNYAREDARPTWPGGDSGITIGIGYDLGYTDDVKFARDWTQFLGVQTVRLLSRALGHRGQAAATLLPAMRTVVVPWAAASQVFRETDMPQTEALVRRTFPNCAMLSLDSMGALVSLVFNRGADCSNTATRREMFQIRLAMGASQPDRIPELIRSMKRLWAGRPGLEGLVTRREIEASLFEEGLREPAVATAPEISTPQPFPTLPAAASPADIPLHSDPGPPVSPNPEVPLHQGLSPTAATTPDVSTTPTEETPSGSTDQHPPG